MEQAEPQASELDQIDALLSGQVDDNEPYVDANGYEQNMPEKAQEPEPDREVEEPESSGSEDEPVVAEKPDIDYDLEIPMPDGREPMKLGELKDKIVENERTRSELDAARADIMQEKQLMAQFAAQVGEIPPALREQMGQKHQQYLEQQHQMMLQAIPEWKDSDRFQNDKPRLFEAGRSLGYSEAELSQIADARLVLALKTLADYREREAKAPEKVVKKPVATKSKQAAYKPKDAPTKVKNPQDLVGNLGEIDKLLGA